MNDWKKELPWDRINPIAGAHGLDPDLVAAFVMTESSGKTGATRFEPKWHYFLFPHALEPEEMESERKKQATSWGLMQVMGSVARELGYEGDLADLGQIDIGLEYGCKLLHKFMNKYGTELKDVIASYNAGSPRKNDDGTYVNEKYVDTVINYLAELKSDRTLGELS